MLFYYYLRRIVSNLKGREVSFLTGRPFSAFKIILLHKKASEFSIFFISKKVQEL